jgi:hypothetical protein
VPPSVSADPGFGQPGYPRHALGYVPPDRRPVRMRHVKERGIKVTSPGELRDVPAREAEGWQVVV